MNFPLILKCLAASALGVLLSSQVQAQSVVSVTKVADLAFGNLAAGSGGTVTVSPSATPSRTPGGAVHIFTGQLAGTVAAAAFNISVSGAETGMTDYSITLPSSVTLTPGNSMTLGSFTTSPQVNSGKLNLANGTTLMYVGATLSVGANQPPGNYSGTFSITVAYP